MDLPANVPKTIDHYMPLIFWHDKKPIMSIDVQQKMPDGQYKSNEQVQMLYKICTASVQVEVRVWELSFTQKESNGAYELTVNFVANLIGHQATLNFAKYSPDGNLIASTDVNGMMCIWKIEPRSLDHLMPTEKPLTDESAQFEIPPNKENWQRAFMPIHHDNDVSHLCFSPCSTMICTAAMNDIYLTNAKNGRNLWINRGFRRVICGLTWDPNGRYIVTMSADRRLDILDSTKGQVLRTCYQITIPRTVVDNHEYPQNKYKLFFDQHVITLTRTPDFSPCGELLFAPAGQLESSKSFTYGTYVFRRCDFERTRPFVFYPSDKPTLMVAVAPVKFELRTDTTENICGLPYRLLFAVMCSESILFYDSQTAKPIGFVYDLTYDNLTSISWTPDGKVLAISSMEAFNIFLHIRTDELVPTDLKIQRCASPPLKKIKDETAKSASKSQTTKPPSLPTQPPIHIATPRPRKIQTTLTSSTASTENEMEH
ncbi:WD-REPEATS-REGION domain-containing protein [Aphelenchoides besseyi]|nr:WD-REPEATS-REGION domain-containing protein [Aphelenchoides besseyi]